MSKISPILIVRDLSVTFPDNNGGLRALDEVSFEVCPQIHLCVGPFWFRQDHLAARAGGLAASIDGQV